jgi:hypothetical protein
MTFGDNPVYVCEFKQRYGLSEYALCEGCTNAKEGSKEYVSMIDIECKYIKFNACIGRYVCELENKEANCVYCKKEVKEQPMERRIRIRR